MTFLPGFLGGGQATVTYTGTNSITTAPPFTWTAQPIGAAAADRLVAVALMYAATGAVSSVTIGGIAATKVAGTVSGVALSEIWVAAVPTGTTANIVVNSGTVLTARFAVSIYAIYGAASATPVATGTSTANPGAATLACTANCAVIGGFCIAAVPGSVRTSWSGITEDNDADFGPFNSYSAASKQDINGSLAIAATPSAAITNVAFAAAAWSP